MQLVAACFMVMISSSPGFTVEFHTFRFPKPEEKKPAPSQPTPPIPPKDIYTFTLSPEKADSPDEYSRREIESLLCSLVLDYITTNDAFMDKATRKCFVFSRPAESNQKKWAENAVITKWFEERVTVTTRGLIAPVDNETVLSFCNTVNKIIGKEKFIFTPGLPLANITVEFVAPVNDDAKNKLLGETTTLDDNLEVRLTYQNPNVLLETYKSQYVMRNSDLQSARFTAEEIQFRNQNRMAKIKLVEIKNPLTRYIAIIHELLHTLGMPGHSPYSESNLFPYTITNPDMTALPETVLPPLAEKMIEMLYRPEILPGMKVKEVAAVLSHMKRIPLQNDSLKSFLMEKSRQILREKASLMDDVKKLFESKTSYYIDLDKQIRLLDTLIAELARIDTKLALKFKQFDPLTMNLAEKQNEIHLLSIHLNSRKRSLSDCSPSNWKTRKEISRIDRLMELYSRLIEGLSTIESTRQKIDGPVYKKKQDEIEAEMKRIVRQSEYVNSLLK